MATEMKPGEQYFNDSLSNHFGHEVEIYQYSDAYTGKVADYRLHCNEPECEDPVGIAAEFISESLTMQEALELGLMPIKPE
jgi:hypothetical protein